jgi:hypothetical protein
MLVLKKNKRLNRITSIIVYLIINLCLKLNKFRVKRLKKIEFVFLQEKKKLSKIATFPVNYKVI